MIGLLWEAAPVVLASEITLRIAAAVIPVGILSVSKRIIDVVVNANTHTGSHESLWPLVVLEFLLASCVLIFGRATDYCDTRLTEEFTRGVSLRLMKHASSLDLESLEDPAFHDTLDRARVQATDRVGTLTTMGQLLTACVAAITLALGVATYSPWLLGLILLCVLPAFLGESHFTFLSYALARSVTPVRRELDYLRTLAASREAAKEVKMFGLGEHLQNRYQKLSDRVIAKTSKLAQRRLRWGSLLGIVASTGYYGAFAYLAFLAYHGKISVGTLTFLAGAIAAASTQLQTIFTLFSHVAEQAMFVTDLVTLLNLEPAIRSRPNALPVPRPISKGFEFRNVWFRYPGTERYILKNLNLTIRAGERVALVGENGQGKTTLVKLMARLYDPTEGSILLDGRDLREYQLEDVRREIGVIFQDFFRYDMSLRDNIAAGRVERLHDDDAVWDAAKKSNIDELAEKLPLRLEQMLGRRFEGGVDLSGGQWQRVALARAYIRDAQVLVLDEPTAALDAAAEAEVFNKFAELTRGRMALLISHRFSTVRMADRIIVLEDGSIEEAGTHHELIAARGPYARLFELQAANYR